MRIRTRGIYHTISLARPRPSNARSNASRAPPVRHSQTLTRTRPRRDRRITADDDDGADDDAERDGDAVARGDEKYMYVCE